MCSAGALVGSGCVRDATDPTPPPSGGGTAETGGGRAGASCLRTPSPPSRVLAWPSVCPSVSSSLTRIPLLLDRGPASDLTLRSPPLLIQPHPEGPGSRVRRMSFGRTRLSLAAPRLPRTLNRASLCLSGSARRGWGQLSLGLRSDSSAPPGERADVPLRPRPWRPPASNTQDGRGGGREVPVSPHAGLLLARARPRPAGCPQPFLPSLAGSAGTKPVSTLRLVQSGKMSASASGGAASALWYSSGLLLFQFAGCGSPRGSASGRFSRAAVEVGLSHGSWGDALEGRTWRTCVLALLRTDSPAGTCCLPASNALALT